MNILDTVLGIFKPATELIDNLHTSEEERLDAKRKMFELQIKAFSQAEEYEKTFDYQSLIEEAVSNEEVITISNKKKTFDI